MLRALLAVLAAPLVAAPAGAQCAEDKLVPLAGNFGAQMGTAVSLSGDHAVLGAPYDNMAGSLTGAVHFFDRAGGGWTHAQKLSAADVEDLDRLGFSVDLSGDVAITGSRYDADAGYATGSAYVFERQGGAWVETAKLLASDMAIESFFGQSVAIEGDLAVVGAHGQDSAAVNAGAVYVFERSGGSWTEAAKLTASDASDADQLGWSVALSGETVITGARGHDELGSAAGAAYVFERLDGVWTQTAKLLASDGTKLARFGVSVDVEGNRAVVGASFDPGTAPDAGAAYVFEREGGTWTERVKITPNDPAAGDLFGTSVALAGKLLAVGAYGVDDVADGAGAVYVFERGTAGWAQTGKVAPAGSKANDGIGFSVGVDSETLLVPARRDDTLILDAGALYTYTPRDLHVLNGEPDEVSVGAGGHQDLTLSTCPARPGAAYFLLGTTSGTEPGFDAGDFHMPLNVDFYLLLSIQAPNLYPLPISQGQLDGEGEGVARFELDPGENPTLIGLTLHHAFGVVDVGGKLLREASNPIPVLLVP